MATVQPSAVVAAAQDPYDSIGNNDEEDEDHDEIYEAYNDNHLQAVANDCSSSDGASAIDNARRRLSYDEEAVNHGSDMVPDD